VKYYFPSFKSEFYDANLLLVYSSDKTFSPFETFIFFVLVLCMLPGESACVFATKKIGRLRSRLPPLNIFDTLPTSSQINGLRVMEERGVEEEGHTESERTEIAEYMRIVEFQDRIFTLVSKSPNICYHHQ
jgi:hypothetical protein